MRAPLSWLIFFAISSTAFAQLKDATLADYDQWGRSMSQRLSALWPGRSKR